MEITFNTMMDVCRYRGYEWKDGLNCNHSDFAYKGELDGFGDDAGYIVRSDKSCNKKICPFLISKDKQ